MTEMLSVAEIVDRWLLKRNLRAFPSVHVTGNVLERWRL